MRYLRTITILAAAMAFAVPGSAQGVVPAKLSVADAITMALGMNPDLKQAEQGRLTSLSRLRIAKYRTSLNLGTSANLDRAGSSSDLSSLIFSSLNYDSPFGMKASLNVSPLGIGSKQGGVQVSLKQALLKGSGLLSSKGLAFRSAQSDATIESKRFFLSRQATVQGVIEAYYGTVLANEQVKVREQAVAFAEQAADGWRKREKEGMAAGIDVSRSEIQVAQTKDSLNSQQRNAHNAIDRLMIAIGAGIGETPELVASVPEANDTVPSLGDCVKTALDNRAELVVHDERLAEQQRQVTAKNDELRPQPDLVASFNGSRNSDGFISRSILDSGLFSTGIEYSLPLDRTITRENSDTAVRQLDVLRNLRAFQMDQITEQVRTAYRRLESARASLGILTANKTVATENLRIANRMMEEGEGSSRDTLDAQQALTQTDSSLLSARTDLYLATIDLKIAMGEDLTQMEFK